jgi:integrase
MYRGSATRPLADCPKGDGTEANYDYEPVVLTFSQCVDILANLDGRHRVLVLADAATGLRISEILALLWSNVDKAHSCIRVTRVYVYGRFGPPKSAASKKPVPLHRC